MKHYKQFILTLICTALCLFASHSFFVTKTFSFTAHIEAQNDFKARVFWTTDSEQKIDGSRYLSQDFQKEKRNIQLNIPVQNLYKFRFDFGTKPGSVTISDMKIKGAKQITLDPNKFRAFSPDVQSHQVTGDKLEIKSDLKNPYMIYGEPIDMKAGISIDWCVFLILLCAYWFIFSKIIGYLAKFKVFEKHSRIDIVFLAAFFGLLFIPMMHISSAEKSKQENRMLARKPHLMQPGGALDNNFGAKFNDWFGDRFWGREALYQLYTLCQRQNRILQNKLAFYDKTSRWMFNKAPFIQVPSDESKKEILSVLEEINKFATQNRIRFYLFIVPHKTDVYSEIHPVYTSNIPRLNNEYIEYFQKNASFPVIYPLQELKEASRNDFVYFKRNHHWTEYGARIGYDKIIQTIQKDFPNVLEASDKDYQIFYDTRQRQNFERDFEDATKIGLFNIEFSNDQMKDEKYKYFNPLYSTVSEIINNDNHRIKYFKNTGATNTLKVVLTGTSNNENLLQFLPYSFREVKYFRFNTIKNVKAEDEYKLLKRYRQEILDFKPDILIISVVADNIPKLSSLVDEN